MNQIQPKHLCILSIGLSSKGFGFVVLEGQDTLVDHGVRTVRGKTKNTQSLSKVKELITRYQPGTLILEDAWNKGSRRASRIQTLTQQIVKMAETLKIPTKLISRDRVMKDFFPDGKGTKYLLAEIMVKRFPEQLSLQLPPKRELWQSEHSRMSIFDAVALALVFRQKYVKRSGGDEYFVGQ